MSSERPGLNPQAPKLLESIHPKMDPENNYSEKTAEIEAGINGLWVMGQRMTKLVS